MRDKLGALVPIYETNLYSLKQLVKAYLFFKLSCFENARMCFIY